MPTSKRPAAKVKLEPQTPAKKHKPPVPAEGKESKKGQPEQGTMSEKKESDEAGPEASVPAPMPEASPVPAEGNVPKAKAAAAKTMSKPAEELPAPGKDAWKDVHAQCTKLAKQGDHRLRSAWEKAKEAGTQKAKREFYYNVFLLDPSVSKKAIHKESLERLQEKETVARGWLTKYQIAKLQGADPQDPEFALLADLAVEGLEERPHEVSAWAKRGMKQYKVCKEMMAEFSKTKESQTKASQEVGDVSHEDFQQAEQALMAVPETRQVTIGGKRKPEEQKAVEPGEAPALPEEYKEAYKSLKKAVALLSTSLDKVCLLMENMTAAPQNSQLKQSTKELFQLIETYSKTKSEWQRKLISFPPALEEPGEEGYKCLEKLKGLKKDCDDDYKSLQKAVGPHKLWAKNHGLG